MDDIYHLIRIDKKAKIPIATQLTEQIAWLIASGHIKPGVILPSLRILSEKLDVNLHTIRAAYQQLEASGLVSARRGKGTTVLSYNREHQFLGMPDVPTFTIGVLIPGYNPFFTPMLKAIEYSVQEEPILTFVGNTHNNAEIVSRYLDKFLIKNVDGILIVSFGPEDIKELTPTLGSPSTLPPIVYGDIPDAPPPSVVFDSEYGGYLAGSHLIGHGHTQIGVITCPIKWSNIGFVYKGFSRALEERGISINPDLVITCQNFSTEAGQSAMNQLLNLAHYPSAIFALGDILAVGALQAIRNRGLGVPEDIALIGYDDSCMSEFMDPPITTIHLPSKEMGRRMGSMVRQLMKGEKPENSQVVLPVDLKIRRSCGCDV
jgi:DNA-binding LacI/PurR family transcriptional regulator